MHNISHAKKGLNMSDATISKLFHPGTNSTRIFKNIKKLLLFNSNSGTNATCRFEKLYRNFIIYYIPCEPAMLSRRKLSGDPPEFLAKSLVNPDKISKKDFF